MIELRNDALTVRVPDVHDAATMSVNFQRTLRIPDDGKEYPLPPGLGRFPVRHVDDHARTVPASWLTHGGVMLPMHQAEALWLSFGSPHAGGFPYPFALKVAAGKKCAITGLDFQASLRADPQDYVVIPRQPWLDGFAVARGVIRQFVAMPLGEGYTAEEQLSGKAEHGGIQIVAYPMKRDVYETLRRQWEAEQRRRAAREPRGDEVPLLRCAAAPDMGLAPGGRMRQQIFDDEYGVQAWDTDHPSRCFIHIANSATWHLITGEAPPHEPPTAERYTQAGLPWFDYYADRPSVEGSKLLKGLRSVVQTGRNKGAAPLPDNDSVEINRIIALREGMKREQVREGSF